MTDVRVWIRVEDDSAQWDHAEDRPIPDGVRVVKNYPKHEGFWAREPKPKTSKAGEPVEGKPSK